ncbi:hypothetical protein [Arvimicrobium flavum]|uniref:hypothetical protein n=1 Tax=Arvimicrobium flavum TaxID=3393320 RepID=UPI00237C41A4|nr:hypothetical protein [Mesorhizobium shangrilense]
MDKAFEQLQADMAHALEEDMGDLEAPELQEEERPKDIVSADGAETPLAETSSQASDAEEEPAGQKIDTVQKTTAHTKNRLEALRSFEGFYEGAQERLREMNSRLSEVTTLHHSVRHVIDVLDAEIHRANDLELSNITLLAEHRKLFDQFQESSSKHQDREILLERLQQREAGLIQDNEALRAALATAKLEAVEAVNTIARNATDLADLSKSVSAKSVDVDRRTQENEALREKNINLSIDLDKAMKREADTRHKFEELSRIHANETTRHSDLLGALARSEKETLRLQKALDAAQAKQSELEERARIVETDREAETTRHLTEVRGLRTELQGAQARLEEVLHKKHEIAGEIGQLKVQLSDLAAEKQVADERVAALVQENESCKVDLLAANTSLSELSLRQTSEQIQLDMRIQECEDLRAEIAALNAQIKELLPYERLHRVTAARQLTTAGPAEFAGVATDKVVPASRRPTGAARSRQARAIRLVE